VLRERAANGHQIVILKITMSEVARHGNVIKQTRIEETNKMKRTRIHKWATISLQRLSDPYMDIHIIDSHLSNQELQIADICARDDEFHRKLWQELPLLQIMSI
jgi:hypothetical protein